MVTMAIVLAIFTTIWIYLKDKDKYDKIVKENYGKYKTPHANEDTNSDNQPTSSTEVNSTGNKQLSEPDIESSDTRSKDIIPSDFLIHPMIESLFTANLKNFKEALVKRDIFFSSYYVDGLYLTLTADADSSFWLSVMIADKTTEKYKVIVSDINDYEITFVIIEGSKYEKFLKKMIDEDLCVPQFELKEDSSDDKKEDKLKQLIVNEPSESVEEIHEPKVEEASVLLYKGVKKRSSNMREIYRAGNGKLFFEERIGGLTDTKLIALVEFEIDESKTGSNQILIINNKYHVKRKTILNLIKTGKEYNISDNNIIDKVKK